MLLYDRALPCRISALASVGRAPATGKVTARKAQKEFLDRWKSAVGELKAVDCHWHGTVSGNFGQRGCLLFSLRHRPFQQPEL